MKKIFIGLSVIFLIFIIGFLNIKYYPEYQRYNLNKSSKSYVDKVIPLIAAAWSEEELIKQASPQLALYLKKDARVFEQFRQLSKLGKLVKYEGSMGNAKTVKALVGDDVAIGLYDANASFEKGYVEFKLRVIRQHNQWRLLVFNVYPNVNLK
jgi:hypothetical protein